MWEEPLGNVAVEAKKADVPSVVFPSGGLPELVVEQGQDGYVCARKDAEALEAGLRHYLDLSETDLNAAKASARVSLERLGITPEAFTRAWQDVYGVDVRPPGEATATPASPAMADQTAATDVPTR